MNDYFYGWYFRCQGEEGSVAVIPAVHLSSEKSACSIQILTQKESLYKEFPVSQFRINQKTGVMQLGNNMFSKKGIRLKFFDERNRLIRAEFRFGKLSEPRYDIMGPFAYLPKMECRHLLYSMEHTVNGLLSLENEKISFQNGRGYMEGDCGTSFPRKYFWTQHFFQKGSLMLAAASIPMAGLHFTGITGFCLLGGREYRFASYLGASIKRIGRRKVVVRQGNYRLYICFSESEGSSLKAPDKGQMKRKVRESIACRAEYTLVQGKKVLLHTVTDQAAVEYDG